MDLAASGKDIKKISACLEELVPATSGPLSAAPFQPSHQSPGAHRQRIPCWKFEDVVSNPKAEDPRSMSLGVRFSGGFSLADRGHAFHVSSQSSISQYMSLSHAECYKDISLSW